MSGLYLEVVEGPEPGRQLPLERPVVIGRGDAVDFALADPNVSRRHCEVTPSEDGVIVRDLGSSNGTFVNNQELVDSARLTPGDDLLVGVTVLELHGARTEGERESAVRAVPAALRVPERTPDYVPAPMHAAEAVDPASSLKPYLDVQVKGRTRLAPLFLLGLAAVFVIVFQLTNGLGSPPTFQILW